MKTKAIRAGMLLATLCTLASLGTASSTDQSITVQVMTDAEAKTDPWFVIGDEDLVSLMAQQNVTIRLPSSLPIGYERVPGVSLRHTVNSVVTPKQEDLRNYLLTNEPSSTASNGDSIEQWYDLPVSLLEGLSHIGVIYRNAMQSEEVLLIIRVSELQNVNDKVLIALGVMTAEHKPVELQNGFVASSILRQYEDNPPTFFLAALSQKDADGILARDDEQQYVTYEFSSETASLDTMKEFADDL